MLIRCWGSRGSIPVSGQVYNKYGGDTTCMEVRSKSGDIIIIDAGSGIRKLGNRLDYKKDKKIDMLFTHAHWDHLLGFPFFRPVFIDKFRIRISGPALNKKSFRDVISGAMRRPYFPVQLEDKYVRARFSFRDIASPGTLTRNGIKIRTISLNHPKDGGLGFRFEEDGKSFVFLTDNEIEYSHGSGHSIQKYVDFCKGADLLIHDAEYTEKDYKLYKSFGHSRYTDAVRLGLEADVGELGLFHLNNMKTDREIDSMVNKSKKIIKNKNSLMKCFAVGNRFRVTL